MIVVVIVILTVTVIVIVIVIVLLVRSDAWIPRARIGCRMLARRNAEPCSNFGKRALTSSADTLLCRGQTTTTAWQTDTPAESVTSTCDPCASHGRQSTSVQEQEARPRTCTAHLYQRIIHHAAVAVAPYRSPTLCCACVRAALPQKSAASIRRPQLPRLALECKAPYIYIYIHT